MAEPAKAAGGAKLALSKKVGPLPLWGWAVVAGGGAFVARMMFGKKASANVATVSGTPAIIGGGGVTGGGGGSGASAPAVIGGGSPIVDTGPGTPTDPPPSTIKPPPATIRRPAASTPAATVPFVSRVVHAVPLVEATKPDGTPAGTEFAGGAPGQKFLDVGGTPIAFNAHSDAPIVMPGDTSPAAVAARNRDLGGGYTAPARVSGADTMVPVVTDGSQPFYTDAAGKLVQGSDPTP